MTSQAFLVLSDITGYTAYLSASELEHAEEVLRSLLELLIEHNSSPLVVQKLEGDAIFSYAPPGGFHQGQTLVETFETTYVAFRKAIELMTINNLCKCNACRNIPNLDLKFFVHYGDYLLQKVGNYSELAGADVTLAHRLMKNHITEKTGLRAYAAYTRAAVDALGIEEVCQSMLPHRETYESIGEVSLYVQDMRGVWERERERARIFVKPEEATISISQDYPVAPPLLWDYITKPDFRAILMGAHSNNISNLQDGRIGPGSVYKCDHGNRVSMHTILDWQPFEQYTTRETGPLNGTYLYSTYRLTPAGGLTTLTIAGSHWYGPWLKRAICTLTFRLLGPKLFRGSLQSLSNRLQQDLAQGYSLDLPPLVIPKQEISQAATDSFQENR